MHQSKTSLSRANPNIIEVKSKFETEFRRFSFDRHKFPKFEDFHCFIESRHLLSDVPFTLSYTDPKDGDLLPINNDDNYAKAIENARPLLRVIVQRKGDSSEELNGLVSPVTDMMVANSSNLIITVRPANQQGQPAPRRGSFSRTSQLSSGSL
ncbi:unnamed protein product, partial [Darwinula stevensoni]